METKSFTKEFEIMRNAEAKSNAFTHAMGIMMYDAETVAPEKSAEGRAHTFGVLAELEYRMMTEKELSDALEVLSEHKDEFSEYEQREIELTSKKIGEVAKIPQNEYIEMVVLRDEATVAWKKAKDASDYSIFEPYLEKIVQSNIKLASYLHPEMQPYDCLLDMYEEGLTTEFCDDFFSKLRTGLLPIIEKVSKSPQIDDSFLHRPCSIEKQRSFSEKIVEMMGLDRTKLTLGEVEHPFTENFNNSDIRLTTHYYETDFVNNMFSVLHEGGHCMYEQNCDDIYNFTSFQGGVSMGIHESQSRFYENIIGRSREFSSCLLASAKEYFPEQMSDINIEKFYKAINRAECGPIRLEADELTYCLHIMVRYEMEKRLISGALSVKDAPQAWNALYREYLGVTPENDAVGILQDSHWAGGSIGYFPSYALGSAYGAQMLSFMKKDIPDLWETVSRGDLSVVTEWLREHFHRHACYYPPKVLFEKTCGKFDPQYFIDYLDKKYTEIYDLGGGF